MADIESETGECSLKRTYLNDNDQVTGVVIMCENPGRLVVELARSLHITHDLPDTDADGRNDWSFNTMGFKTTVSGRLAFIRSVSRWPDWKDEELHHAVFEFLKTKGIEA